MLEAEDGDLLPQLVGNAAANGWLFPAGFWYRAVVHAELRIGRVPRRKLRDIMWPVVVQLQAQEYRLSTLAAYGGFEAPSHGLAGAEVVL